MDCAWSFVSDLNNQSTLLWLFALVPGYGIWRVTKHLIADAPAPFKLKLLIGFYAVVSILLISGVVWMHSLITEYCPDCTHNKAIAIEVPEDNAIVGKRVPIVGRASPDRLCYFVNVYVHNLGDGGGQIGGWMPAHVTQTDIVGNWSAVVNVTYPSGTPFEILAYLSHKPVLLSPSPTSQFIGLPSNLKHLTEQ